MSSIKLVVEPSFQSFHPLRMFILPTFAAMGVIKRQGFKQSAVNYIGVIIGVISTIFIYPLDKATVGFAQFLMGTALLMSPVLLLGSANVSIRFFPEFKDEKSGHHGYWLFLHGFLVLGLLLVLFLLFIFQDQVKHFFEGESPLFQEYVIYIVPIAILMAVLQINTSYCANFKRIAIPSIFQVFIKISLPILVLLYYFKYIAIMTLVWGLIVNFIIAAAGVLIYVWWLGQMHFKIDFAFLNKARLNEIGKYASYGVLSGVGSMMAFRIDTFMVPTLIDFQQNGVYVIALFIGNAIAIPSVALLAIAAPLISESLKEKDFSAIKNIYQRSSTSLFWIGMLLFCLVILSVEDIFLIMPNSEEMEGGFWVVLFIGLAKVVDMATSTNHQIIAYSEYYRYNLYMILVLSTMNIAFNWWLIPIYGIAGAAVASMLSISFYNIIKVGFVYWKYKMQPFTKSSIYIFLLGIFSLGIVYSLFLDMQLHPILAVGLKSFVVILIYVPLALWFRLSPDINDVIFNFIDKIRRRK